MCANPAHTCGRTGHWEQKAQPSSAIPFIKQGDVCMTVPDACLHFLVRECPGSSTPALHLLVMIGAVRVWDGPIRLALTLHLALRCTAHSAGNSPLLSCAFSPVPRSKSIGTAVPARCESATRLPPMSPAAHVKSRCPVYPGSQLHRFPVVDSRVQWDEEWPEYQPVRYTAPVVLAKPVWADPDIEAFSPRFNALDGSVDRRSHEGQYRLLSGKPLNPHGRTGVTGRGLLGRWGPNHAADPIVTRWKRDMDGQPVVNSGTKLPVLQFVSIMRKDCKEWAIPGGMVDPGELVSVTLRREFSEEALNSLAVSLQEREQLSKRIAQLFSSPGLQVYRGYVDDPRNTDNAWMETVAVNFHDETGDSVSELPLQAGDDAGQVTWMDIDSTLSYYASHSQFLEMVANKRHAHW